MNIESEGTGQIIITDVSVGSSMVNPDIDFIEAAKPATEVRFRCPNCQKLYATANDVFAGEANPEFECVSCTKSFNLTTQMNNLGLYQTEQVKKLTFDTCPKCSALKIQKTDECPSCGVYASKFIEIQKFESPTLYELNRGWQLILGNFEDDILHQNFINDCRRKMALNFAFKKYTDFQMTIGQDSICEKYLKQIELRMEQQFKSTAEQGGMATGSSIEGLSFKSFLSHQGAFLAVGGIGFLALLYNKFIPTFPNFNGIVTIITVVAFSVAIFSGRQQQS